MVVQNPDAPVCRGRLPTKGRQTMSVMSKNGQWILMIGRSSPLVEGVHDLLQVVGYRVDMSSSWTETEYAMHILPPNLVIVDVSSANSDVFHLAEQIRDTPYWSEVPILFISFSGDDRIHELQRRSRRNGDDQLHFYSHTLLSMEELLEKVRVCLS
jgi:PleD family two-component response regulator